MLKYNRKVDKAEANSQITVGSLLEGLCISCLRENVVDSLNHYNLTLGNVFQFIYLKNKTKNTRKRVPIRSTYFNLAKHNT